jgi:hypothetical protein
VAEAVTTPQRPLIDPGNPMLERFPAQMDTGTVDIQGAGTFGVMTIRSANTTLTVMLGADDLREWSKILGGLADQLGGGLVKASPFDVSALDSIQKRLNHR